MPRTPAGRCPSQISPPVLRRYAPTTPPPLAATTTPPATAGVPLTAPLISACHAAFRRLAAAASSAAPGGCPSRDRSPRYIGHSPTATGDADGGETIVHPARRAPATRALAILRKRYACVLLAPVNGLRAGGARLTRADPAMENRQRTRRPPVGPAEEPHHGRHDEDPYDRGVDCDRDRQADADRLDDHDVGHSKC